MLPTHPSTLLYFGGTFDPPHMAHVALPLLAMHALGADGVLYVPAARSPHKLAATQTPTPAHHRLAMLRLALEHIPAAHVLTDELDRANTQPDQPSYTVDTLESLRQRLGPDVTLRLLIGADQLAVFHDWHRAQRIVQLAQPLVMVRPPHTREALLASLSPGINREAWSARFLDLPQLDLSATALRRRAALGHPLTGLVPPAVEDYIRRHHLYRQAMRL
ncbi:MAG: nicotinate (nicotinamide) nucleotide adenylyltransferase [Phycisphaeraceae bacterium]